MKKYPFKTFGSTKEIIEYLDAVKTEINEGNEVDKKIKLVAAAINSFASHITDEPSSMMAVHKWFDLTADASLASIIRKNLYVFENIDLNLYKLKIICNLRGPSNMEEFVNNVSNKLDDAIIQEIGIHKDFPVYIKEKLYELTQDVKYLSKDAQDIFVF